VIEHAKRPRTARPAPYPPKPRTRRVPIEITDALPTVGPQDDLLVPVSSRPLDRPSPTASLANVALSPGSRTPENKQLEQKYPQSTSHETKQTRSTKYGGGIFRSSGSHTIFTPETSSAPRMKPQTDQPPWPAMTLAAFTRSWNTLTTDRHKWALLQQIPPASLSSFFGSSLEADALSSMLSTLHMVLSSGESEQSLVQEYMMCLPSVPRFSLIYTFLSRDDKNCAKEIWTLLDVAGVAGDENQGTKKLWGV
jgi:hypothetical protein